MTKQTRVRCERVGCGWLKQEDTHPLNQYWGYCSASAIGLDDDGRCRTYQGSAPIPKEAESIASDKVRTDNSNQTARGVRT